MDEKDQDDVFIEEMIPEGSEEDLEAAADRADAKVKKLKDELEKVKREKQEYLDGWQRAKADYVNALKRFEEERRDAVSLGRLASARAFLPVLDTLSRAESFGELPEAMKGIARELHEAMSSLGLTPFGAIGEEFNPAFHEALGQELASSKDEDNKITEVYETGWKSQEAVVRPAKVRVSYFE